MSLFSFLKNPGGIKHLFDGMPNELKGAIHVGAMITENIKKFVNSSAAGVLSAIVPGEIGDKVKVDCAPKHLRF